MSINKKILIIDDESELRSNIIDLVEDITEDYIEASDGEEGLAMFHEHGPFACIICDIRMPNMDGVEFAKAIRQLNTDVPLIFFTAHGNKNAMLKAIKYGVFDFVNKPYYDNLAEIVQRAINFSNNKKDEKTEDQLVTEYKKLFKAMSE